MNSGVEQLVARGSHNPKVDGATPSPASKGALVYKLGRHPFTVEKAERYRYALLKGRVGERSKPFLC